MSDTKWQILQTTELLSSVESPLSLAWSQCGAYLSLLSSRGLLIYELLPSPTCALTSVNFRPHQLNLGDSNPNPYLSKLANKYGLEEMTSIFGHVEPTNFVLDDALPVIGKPVEGSNNRKQIYLSKWAPTRSMAHKSSSALAFLNYSHHIQVAYRGPKEKPWTIKFDVTKLWFEYLKQTEWKEECKIRFPNTPNSKMEALMSKCYLISTMTFSWCDVILEDEDQVTSYLVTCQKSGHLILWSMKLGKAGKNFVDILTVEKVIDTDLGKVLSVDVESVSPGKCLIFVGAADGRIRVFLFDGVDLVDVGFAWDEKDQLSVSMIRVVDVEGNAFKVFVAKAYFSVMLKLSFDGHAVRQCSKPCAVAGSSNVINVERLSGNQFVVVSRVGPLRTFKTSDKNFSLSPFEMAGADSLDFSNQNCNGFVASTPSPRGLWCLLQNGGLEISRPKGRLTFLVQKIDSWPDILQLSDAEARADLVEVVRFRLIQLVDEDDAVVVKILDLVKKAATTRSNWRFTMWLCQLMAWLSGRNGQDNESTEFSDLYDLLYTDALTDRALEVCNLPDGKADRKQLSAMVDFIRRYSPEKLSQVQDVAKSSGSLGWTCALCGKGQVDSGEIDLIVCESGHKFSRCCRTLQACDAPTLEMCQWCHATYLMDDDSAHCVLCHGLVSQ